MYCLSLINMLSGAGYKAILLTVDVPMLGRRLNEYRNNFALPDDMQYFERVTLGKTVVMGTRTFEEVGHPLPGRRNVVLTRSSTLSLPGVEMISADENRIPKTIGSPLSGTEPLRRVREQLY